MSKQFANLMTRMPPKKVRRLLSSASPQPDSSPNPHRKRHTEVIHVTHNETLVEDRFRMLDSKDFKRADTQIQFHGTTKRKEDQSKSLTDRKEGSRRLDRHEPAILQSSKVSALSNLGIPLTKPAMVHTKAHCVEMTEPASPESENSSLSRVRQTKRMEMAEDCEVPDEDEGHNSTMHISNGFTIDCLAVRTHQEASPSEKYSRAGRAKNFEGVRTSIVSSAKNHNRQSSGTVSRKLVTNESIKPLPTSFAINEKSGLSSSLQLLDCSK